MLWINNLVAHGRSVFKSLQLRIQIQFFNSKNKWGFSSRTRLGYTVQNEQLILDFFTDHYFTVNEMNKYIVNISLTVIRHRTRFCVSHPNSPIIANTFMAFKLIFLRKLSQIVLLPLVALLGAR